MGDKRPRALSSKNAFEAAQERKEIHQRLELLEHVHSQEPVEERMETILSLHAQAEDENKHLVWLSGDWNISDALTKEKAECRQGLHE